METLDVAQTCIRSRAKPTIPSRLKLLITAEDSHWDTEPPKIQQLSQNMNGFDRGDEQQNGRRHRNWNDEYEFAQYGRHQHEQQTERLRPQRP